MASRTAPVNVGDIVELTVTAIAPKGRGIARMDGFVVFVARGLPGDRINARITRVRRRHAEAVLDEVVEAAPDRIEPPCAVHSSCGGCAWQALDYAAQARTKQEHVVELLERIAKIEDPPVLDILAADNPFGYRNKMEYTFLQDGDKVAAGFHKLGRWDELIAVDPCLIADERGVAAHRVVVSWANQYGLTAYDKTIELPEEEAASRGPLPESEGLLRNLIIRVGKATGQVMVHVVSTSPELPRAAELVDELEEGVPGLASVLHTHNGDWGDGLEGLDPVIMWGNEAFEETIAGVNLRVRPNSFLQPNSAMSERLYELVREYGEFREDDVVYDVYCGIGSIGIMLAQHVKQVVGIEVVEEAIFSARENAAANGALNMEFLVGNARPILKFIGPKAEEGIGPEAYEKRYRHPNPDVVVVDPPRAGLSPKVIKRIAAKQPRRIVYVSCNPGTFASDLVRFAEEGYELEKVRPVDQFPHTPHVEVVSALVPTN